MSGSLGLVGGLVGAGVGFLVGGPLGASIGWAVGSMAGSLIDQPKANNPRIYDTKVRGADYGTPRAILYGMCRIGGVGAGQGSIVNGPNEFTINSESSGGGKGGGGGGQSVDHFKLSFFNEICEGEIAGVRRRWVNNKLWTTNEEPSSERWPYTLYLGDATQTPDPTMETIYGNGNVNPMRGVACEMVTELNLDDWGQQRPNVEYEAYTASGTIPWRVVLFDPWPASTVNGIAHGSWWDADSLVLWTWHFERISNVINFFVNRFNLDGTQIGSTVQSMVTDVTGAVTGTPGASYTSTLYWGIRNAPAVAINGPGPADVQWWVLDRDEGSPTFMTFIGGAGVAGMFLGGDVSGLLYPYRLQGNYNVRMGNTVYGVDADVVTIITNRQDPSGVDSGGISESGDSYALDGAYNVSDVKLGTSDDGHLYVIVDSGGPDHVKMWKLTSDLSLAHFWDTAATDVTNLNQISVQNFHVYNNFIAYQRSDPVVKVSVVKINSDMSLQNYGDELQHIHWRLAALDGTAYGIDGDGIYSLQPPPSSAILGDIVTDILHRAGLAYTQIDMSDLTDEVRGVVFASQMTAHNMIQLLRQGFFFDVTEYNGKIVGRKRGHGATDTIPDGDLCAHEPGSEVPEPLAVRRIDELELPRTVFVNFYNVDNDYQRGNTFWARTVTRSQSDVTLDLPIVYSPGEALRVAQWHMHFAWLERDLFTFYVSDAWMKLRPTNVVVVRGVNIRLTSVTEMPSGVIRCEGVRAFAGAFNVNEPIDGEIPGSGGSGQPPQEPPQAKVQTTLVMIDGPLVSETDSPTASRAAVFPAGSGPWPGATIMKSVDGGSNYSTVLSAPTASTVGVVATATSNFLGGNVLDTATVIRVVMRPGQTLASTTLASLLDGANLIALGKPSTGWEYLQYMTATLVTTGTYDLTGLLRGRFGTEWKMSTHAANEYLVVVGTTYAVPGALAELGVARKYKAVTNGTAVADATAVDFTNAGVAGEALSPVLLGYGVDGAGDVTLTCVPRRRGSGGWPNGTDLPATDPANWQFEISATAGFPSPFGIGATSPTATFTAAQQTTVLGGTGLPFYWRVAQFAANGGLGYYAESYRP